MKQTSLQKLEKTLGIAQFRLNHAANAGGTSLVGDINLVYSHIVKVFGEPQECDNYKVSGQWTFEDDAGHVFTLYDWKETDLYDEDYPSVEKFRASRSRHTFHIGGNSKGDHVLAFAQWLERKILAGERVAAE